MSQFKNVSKAEEFLMSIIEDYSMRLYLAPASKEEKQEEIVGPKGGQNEVVTEESSKQPLAEEKSQSSRFEIEIQRQKLPILPIQGELFIALVNAELVSNHSNQRGKLIMTNYRLVFVQGCRKLVNTPFGCVDQIEYYPKRCNILLKLKYPHSWKFQVDAKKFQQLRAYLQIYSKSSEIRSSFAYSFAAKADFRLKPISQIWITKFKRIKLLTSKQFAICQQNATFQICTSYPAFFIIKENEELRKNQNLYLSKLRSHRRQKRFPIIVYLHNSLNRQKICLWSASEYDPAAKISSLREKRFLRSLRQPESKLVVFYNNTSKEAIYESSFDEKCEMVLLSLPSLQQSKEAENQMHLVYMHDKKPYLKEVLATKWYHHICLLLASAGHVKNKILNGEAVLLRFDDGVDRNLQIAALVELILDPFSRTYEGFEILVETQFIQMGHPFATRLGERESRNIFPTFLEFLDCVTQLLHQNLMCFQFNSKYLARLANLMFTNIYGTFLADSPREHFEGNILNETVSIWKDLHGHATDNGCYEGQKGMLSVNHDLSAIKIWKEHFEGVVVKVTSSLGFRRESGFQFLNEHCLALKIENRLLSEQLYRQNAQIGELEPKVHQKLKTF